MMSAPKIKSILLIGFDSNIGLGVIFCLKSYNYDLYLLTHNLKNAARHSKFVKNTFFYNDEKDDLSDFAVSIVSKYNIDFILPYDELETRKIHEKEAVLNKIVKLSIATDPEYFNIGIHKLRLAQFLTANKIPCPSFATFDNKTQINKLIDEFGFPLLVKPVRQSAGRMIQKLHDWNSLNIFFEKLNCNQEDFIIQPFIVGSDITCNVICKDGQILCHTIQESPVKVGSNFSTNDILEFHNDDEVISIVSSMMKLLHWNGVACVDLRRSVINNSINVLEINGRFWASVVSSFTKAGLNFPLILLKTSLGEPIEIEKQKSAIQVSLKKYVDLKLQMKPITFHDTKYESYFSDPLARIMQILKL
ncbi:MAG: ATP-grasp domain-containing protein [Bacteroidota bacterium]